MATQLQQDVALDAARIKSAIEAGTDRYLVVELERGARVQITDTTETYYGVFPCYPGSTAYSGDGVGIRRTPGSGAVTGDDQLHRLSLVVKRAYRAAK